MVVTDSHLATRIKTCILRNGIVPKLACAKYAEGAVQIAAAEKILGNSKTTNNLA